MGLSEEQLRADVDALVQIEPLFGSALARVGYPPTRIRERGYVTLMRTIVGQQVSVKAADAMWRKLTDLVGEPIDLARIGRASDDELRAAGISRQKSAYLRSLAEEVLSGRLDFANLPEDDEAAIAQLVQVKGVGRWSAEIYLLFAEGRRDIWPAGDLAVQIEIGKILGHEARPSEKLTRAWAEAWRPHRGAAAIFAWHHYGAKGGAAPV
ncbi:DNA-3-methyladenine glycosylase family protein [Sphingomonas sp. IC4-52]|uniref:DNA-3-methyladenine glycosylase family protein n=1 Tax=Sphingomonas sp. IC4-52 TaxID=2887202 RepID=UPI001D11FE7E|nr:DNA-3-methyladenine glycosylase 2 family protein [Sphingomonas sp. IC4-52]MCC2978988.1 DNA-3-methyladenine glycosylase 2 family protein [Sphingomonas sp. IC4-52]